MNRPTATLTILVGILVSLLPVKLPAQTFEQRWEPLMFAVPPLGLTEQKLLDHVKRREVEPVRIIPIRTIRILPNVPPEPELASVQAEPAPEIVPLPPKRVRSVRYREVKLDICQRHGMHKQITRGGKSWRCRK